MTTFLMTLLRALAWVALAPWRYLQFCWREARRPETDEEWPYNRMVP